MIIEDRIWEAWEAGVRRLEQKAARPFTLVDKGLLFYLVPYFAIVVALPAYIVWHACGALLDDPPLLLVLVVWLAVAIGWGVRILRTVTAWNSAKRPNIAWWQGWPRGKHKEARHEKD